MKPIQTVTPQSAILDLVGDLETLLDVYGDTPRLVKMLHAAYYLQDVLNPPPSDDEEENHPR